MYHYNVKTNFAPPHNITYTDNNEEITDMSNNYPYVLTPPMDLPDLQSVSGGNSPHQVYASPFYGGMFDTEDEPNSGVQPYLTIVEQPSDRFRFRYKSEMAGTHGSLTGKNSDKARKQTYPTVQLHNCKIPAVIRCSLYQYSREDMIHTRQPHAHRLVKKQGTEEIDDPHDIHVNVDESYTATFHSMGIIHTAKKNIVSELEKKNKKLKLEEVARNDGICRPLSKKEEQEMRVLAERESKTINLNIVCLRFDAYKVINNIYRPICNPVYSSPINNLKSALTGDLKIVRMDHFTSPSRGGKEIFILVEKVTKKNIKVRLYELDDDDKEIWSDYGRFTDLDVHHQYAIVFKTPPYKVLDIETEAKVFIELQRPSDGARSEPKDFTYIPTKIMHNRKRARYESSSISSCNMSSAELPITINSLGDNQCNLYGAGGNNLVNSDELTEALKNNDIDSLEFDKLCQFMLNSEPGIYDITSQEGLKSLVLDAPKVMDCSVVKSEIPCPREVVGYSLRSLNTKEVEIVDRFKEQLISFIKTKPSKERMSLMLDRLFEDSIDSDSLETVLHLLVAENDQNFLLLLLKLLFRYQETNLVNLRNRKGQTALHLAVESHNSIALQFLIYTKADVTIRDLEGNNVLHIAVMGNAPIRILKLLCVSPEIRTCIDQTNYDGFTALHLAVEANNLTATKMLCWNHANVNIGHKKTGDTALHMAVTGHSFDIVKFLLDNTDADVHQKNYRQHSPAELAKLTTEENSLQPNSINQLFDCTIKSEQFSEEIDIKEEDVQIVSDDDTVVDDDIDIEGEDKMEVEIKSERSGLSTMDFKEEQVSLYEYTNVKELSEECLNRVSELLTLSNNWISLGELLGHDHLINTGVLSSARKLLYFATKKGDKILEIRNFLEDLDEFDAVKCIDNMIISIAEQKK